MIHMRRIDFEIVDAFGGGSRTEGGDVRMASSVGGPKCFTGSQLRCRDEFLAVLTPERVVAGRADRRGFTFNVDVDDIAGGMSKPPGDDLPSSEFDFRTGLYGGDERAT